MNWRKLIYSIIIPSIAGFTFGIFISIGTLTNAIVFFYGIVMMIAAFLSSTGKGKNGDAFSTVIMGALVTGVTYLFISMIGELSEDLIMTGDEIDVENLFSDDGGEEETQVTPPAPKEKEEKEIEKTTEEEEINPDDLFDNPESVGSGKDNQEEEEDTQSEKDKGTSPKTNFYSSIASALKEEGIFPDLDDDTLNGIKTPEDFAEAVEKTVQARLDERQK